MTCQSHSCDVDDVRKHVEPHPRFRVLFFIGISLASGQPNVCGCNIELISYYIIIIGSLGLDKVTSIRWVVLWRFQ